MLFGLCIGDGAGTVRAWDWRRAGGGAVASARGHVGAVTAVTSLHSSRADVAASAGVDGVVRVLSLDGADGACIMLLILVRIGDLTDDVVFCFQRLQAGALNWSGTSGR